MLHFMSFLNISFYSMGLRFFLCSHDLQVQTTHACIYSFMRIITGDFIASFRHFATMFQCVSPRGLLRGIKQVLNSLKLMRSSSLLVSKNGDFFVQPLQASPFFLLLFLTQGQRVSSQHFQFAPELCCSHLRLQPPIYLTSTCHIHRSEKLADFG